MRAGVGALALWLCAGSLHAQQPTWVFLEPDAVRTGQLVSGERPRAMLENDRAIPQALINRIEQTGARVRYTSRWLQAVSVDADEAALARLRAVRGVRALKPIGQVFAEASPRAQHAGAASADFDSAFYGANWRAIRQLGIPSSHVLGFNGRNIRIAILDTGFEPAHEALATRRVAAQRDFINRDAIVSNQPGDPTGTLDQEVHGTWVWSILGGHQPGRIVGPAYEAVFILAKVDVVQTSSEQFAADEDRWVAAVEWADSMGARVINSSLTFRNFLDKPDYPASALDGDVTISARMADEAARRGILVVSAAGNLGPEPESLGTPADADSIVAVGAADTLGNAAVFRDGTSSSRGPTADGRLKPELVAPGKGITGARSSTLDGYDTDLEGTSIATPFIAGGAAMFMQAWPNLTIMAVRGALLLSGSRAETPDNNVGFGVPDISSAILFPEGLTAVGITTGSTPAGELTTIQPGFTWSAPLVNAAMRPVRYILQIATDPAFNNIIYTDTTENSGLTIKRPLRPAAALWWRVVAEAFPDVRRTSRARAPFSVPDWVRLLTFNTPGTSFTDSVQPTLRWEPLSAPPPSGPLTFDVQILSAQTGVPVQTIPNITSPIVRVRDPLTPNISYKWRVIARSPLGPADTVESVGSFLVTSDQQPPVTLLYQNFPNPFPRPDLGETSTRVWFDVHTESVVELAVYDLRGRLLRQLIPANPGCGAVTLIPGEYGRIDDPNPCVSTHWDATTANGETVPRGIYLLRLRAGGTDQVKRILYMPNR